MASDSPAAAASAAEGVCAFLRSLGVTSSSTIQLVGRGALPSLLWLCRHGFQRVAIVSGTAPSSESADLLLCLDTSSAARLTLSLRRVRHGGLAIVRGDRMACLSVARRSLNDAGFRIERRLTGERRDVYIARRIGYFASTVKP
ncbi:MAG TPA: hypothetical protein VFE13_03325 [Caulobacteraceae bacterium]|jgi:hypothetical protein|nr:hypothetical protein [Caulobacteraceae bacterium]